MSERAYQRVTDSLGSVIDLCSKVESNLIRAKELHGCPTNLKLSALEQHLNQSHSSLQQSLAESRELMKGS